MGTSPLRFTFGLLLSLIGAAAVGFALYAFWVWRALNSAFHSLMDAPTYWPFIFQSFLPCLAIGVAFLATGLLTLRGSMGVRQ